MKRLAIGLLLDPASPTGAIHPENVFLRWASTQPRLKLMGVMIPAPSSPAPRVRHALARHSLRGLLALEARVFKLPPALHRITARNARVAPLECVHTVALATEAGAGEPEELERLRALKLDWLLCVDPAISAARRCQLAPYAQATAWGLLRLCGARTEEPCAPGFWEVAQRAEVTRFAVTRMPANDNLGTQASGALEKVLVAGGFATRFHLLLNQLSWYAHAYQSLQSVLTQAGTQVPRSAPTALPDCGPPRGIPGQRAQLRYLKTLGDTLGRKLRDKYWRQNSYRWGVAWQNTGWQNLRMHRAQRIPNPPGRFLADPFLVREQQQSICFVEDYDYGLKRAVISAYALTSESALRIGPVITEDFHLSFPFPFRYQSRLYLCPESASQQQIRVYECVRFPHEWRLHKVLMSNVRAADSMLFPHEGRWWLLTNLDRAGVGDFGSELHLFYADQPLTQDWTPHPLNPVIVDPQRARNAGLLHADASLYRVSQQQGFDAYGKAAHLNRIIELSPTRYAEETLKTLTPDFFPNLKGTHHLHSDGHCSVFDFQY